MNNKGFAELAAKGLIEKAAFTHEHEVLRRLSNLDVIMLQLVLRAAHGDSAAVRLVLNVMKETQPASQRGHTYVYSLDANDNVVNERDGIVLGHISEFPDLPQTSGPVHVPKEYLFPKKKRKRPKA